LIPHFELDDGFVSASRNVPVIGLTGGIGSGKSAVAGWLAERRNVCVIDGDAIGHDVLRRPEIRQRLREEFGNDVLAADDQVDRRRLAAHVFGSSPQQRDGRRRLERIVHPEIRRRISETISRESASDITEAVILDAAVLLEAGWNDVCTAVAFIDSPREARQQRVKQSRGWSDEDLRKREASQMDLEEKKSHADLIISNDSTLERAGRMLEEFVDRLIADDE
jgi:dephospho-CoA kinase